MKCFIIFLLSVLPSSLSWTDFSQTVINTNGIYDLYKLKASCPRNMAIRGFALDKPSLSTLRWALQCIKPSNLDKSKALVSKKTNVDKCDDSRIIWLDRHYIKCDPDQVLHSFTFLNNGNEKECYFLYECLPLTSSLCHFNLDQPSKTVNNHLGDLRKFPLLPVIANQKDSALIGFQFRMSYNDNNIWETFIYYGWCVTSVPNYNSKSTGIDVEVFFKLDDAKMITFLSDFYEYYRRIEKYISFTPHYLINGNAQYTEEYIHDVNYLDYITNNCVSKGKYCYDIPPNSDENSMGRYFLLETVRQQCIHHSATVGSMRNNIKGLYWDFIYYYKNHCSPESAFRLNCGSEIFDKYNFNGYNVMQCIANSFGGSEGIYNDDLCDNDNKILERESVIAKEKNITIENSPVIIIDGNKYITKLQPKLVFEEICLKIIKALDYYVTPCAKYYQRYKTAGRLMKVLITVFILLFVFIIWGICYRRKIEKDIVKKSENYVQLQEQSQEQ